MEAVCDRVVAVRADPLLAPVLIATSNYTVAIVAVLVVLTADALCIVPILVVHGEVLVAEHLGRDCALPAEVEAAGDTLTAVQRLVVHDGVLSVSVNCALFNSLG